MRTEDGSIIQECFDGKPEAFGLLVDKYKGGIFAFVYGRLGRLQDAQDVTQEVFVEAYRGLQSLRRWESFVFWLYRIARNLCVDWIKAESRRPDSEFIEDQDPDVLESPSLDSYREGKLGESLREALDALPEIYREVLMLHYFGGMAIKEIARAVGASPAAIGKRLSRARSQLREEMVAMMDTAFEGQRLQASFTFRVVEAVKRIKIHPMPRTAGLPWGLSLAVGIFITVMSLNLQMSITDHIAMPTGSPLPVESKVLRTREVPVDILKTSEVSVISSKQGDGDGGEPQQDRQKAFYLAPAAQGDMWAKKANMPTVRRSLATCVVDGKIYAIGGTAIVPNVHALSTVEEYDPTTDTWAKKADMPTARTLLGAGVVNGRIYAIGGRDGENLLAVEEYDPATDTWAKKSDMPTPRCGFSTSVVNEKIYIIGGSIPKATCSSLVEEYDPATDTWTEKSDMPTARYFSSSSAVNGRIYVIGGSAAGPMFITAAVEEYDPVADRWTKKATMPTARGYLSSSAVKGKIYAIGGSRGLWGGSQSKVEEYDPVTDTWTKKADMPTARGFLCTSAVKERIYAIGGANSDDMHFSTVEEYDTGLAVEPKGKSPTKWGDVKSD